MDALVAPGVSLIPPRGLVVMVWVPVIRAVVGFVRSPRAWARDEVEEVFREAVIEVDEAYRRLVRAGFTVLSKRVVFPKIPAEIYCDVPSYIEGLVPRDYYVSLGPVHVGEVGEDVIISVVHRGYYTSIAGSVADNALRVSRIIHRLSVEDPVYPTRLAVAIGGDVPEAPYFPLTRSSGEAGIGISFLYPEIIDYYMEHGLRKTMKLLRETTRRIRSLLYDKRLIIDYTISPWMDNTVAGRLEKLCNCRLDENGFLHAIRVATSIIRHAAAASRWSGGFNEVMLPLAEDNRLKEAALEGRLRARDFLLYSTVCVAGPDMLAVPRGVRALASYIRDAAAIASALKKPLGLRVVAADADPGEEIELGRFGKTPIIPY